MNNEYEKVIQKLEKFNQTNLINLLNKLEVCICQHQIEKKYKKFEFSSEYKKAEVYFNSDSFYSASYASSLPQIPFSSRKSLVLIRYFSIIFTGL